MKLRYWPIVYTKLPANAMALYPVMLFKTRGLKSDALVINHEKIHFRQQLELLILPFYFLYFVHYLLNRLKYKNHEQAYFNICFEREAYANDLNLNYLAERKPYAWLRFLKSQSHNKIGNGKPD
jgi:hypothetical protein